jgi:hypothetical protein
MGETRLTVGEATCKRITKGMVEVLVGEKVYGLDPFSRTATVVNFRPSGCVAPRILPGADTRGWSAISSFSSAPARSLRGCVHGRSELGASRR